MNKFLQTKPVSRITHPLIADMYLKKGYAAGSLNQNIEGEDVLVIETHALHSDDNTIHTDTDSHLFDLLADLLELKKQAEKNVGHFDRIDIRAH